MMKTLLPSQLLTQQHDALDIKLNALITGTANIADVVSFIEGISLHIYIEEDLLFPLINKPYIKTGLSVMYQEHLEIWQCLEQMKPYCSDKPFDENLVALAKQLESIFAAHNPKEEDAIYPPLDDYFHNEYTQPTLVDDINDAVLPENWQCRLARELNS